MRRKSRSAPHSRHGFAVALVFVAALIAGVLIFAFQQSVIHEFRGTSRLVRAARAESIGESAVAKIASAINHDPWEERFYLRYALRMGAAAGGAPAIEYPFNHESFPFHEDGPEFANGSASFVGTIHDISANQKRYRVRVMVQFQGAEILLVYDLRHTQGVLGPLNRDPVVQRATLDEETPMDVVDSRVTAIWEEAQDPLSMIDGGEDQALLTAVEPQPPEEAVFAAMEEPPAPPPEVVSPEEFRDVAEPAAEGVAEILDETIENPSYRPPPPTADNPWGLPEGSAGDIPYEQVPDEALPPEYQGGIYPPPADAYYPPEVGGQEPGGSAGDTGSDGGGYAPPPDPPPPRPDPPLPPPDPPPPDPPPPPPDEGTTGSDGSSGDSGSDGGSGDPGGGGDGGGVPAY